MAALCHESIELSVESDVKNLIGQATDDFQWRSLDSVLKTVLERLRSASLQNDASTTVSGKSIGDIPSTYQIPALRHHERAVVGTFVHPDIVPGFKYTARANGTTDFIFERKPKLLESIGQGYGKRLTFESEDILNNNNYFWSDSSPMGYAFSIHVIDVATTFLVYENEKFIGTCLVKSVHDEQEIINSRNDNELMQHIKEVHVNFNCLFSVDTTRNEFLSDVAGFVRVTKGAREAKASTQLVHALLTPSMKRFVLKPKPILN